MSSIDFAVSCASVIPIPLVVTSSPATVCAGSTATFIASGATTYVWSNGVSGNTDVIRTGFLGAPTLSIMASNSYGCSTYSTVSITGNTNCAVVWPGDANSDGSVDGTDVLELGLGFSATGGARSGASNTFTGQQAPAWTGTVSTGWNLCHADCNGDGTISLADTLAIFNNFSMTHSFKPVPSSGDINVVSSGTTFTAGRWNKADIIIGSSSSPQSQLYGVSFDLNFNQSLVVPDSLYITYTSSFLNSGTTNVNFRKFVSASGKAHLATVRTDKINVNGNGKIAEFYYKVKDGISPGAQMNLSINAVNRISNTGQILPLTGGSESLDLEMNPVSLSNVSQVPFNFQLKPNPAKSQVSVGVSDEGAFTFTIYDLTGRVVKSGVFTHGTTINIESLQSGVYIFDIRNESVSRQNKLVIEK
jgi:hypothetical protein